MILRATRSPLQRTYIRTTRSRRRVASTLRQYLYLIFISSAPGNCVRARSDATREEHTLTTRFPRRGFQERCLATMNDSCERFSSHFPDSPIVRLASISLPECCLTRTFPYLHFNSKPVSRGTVDFKYLARSGRETSIFPFSSGHALPNRVTVLLFQPFIR